MSTDPTIISGGERMFAQRRELFKGLVMLVCALALLGLSGCGDDAADPGAATADTAEADPGDLEVIEAWSEALTTGDVEGAAGYFATPSTAENGPVLLEIRTLEDAIEFNDSLPCGAELISARTEGDFTSATFRLSERPGGGCGPGAGGTASTSFVIEDGEIVEWRRIGDAAPGGDGGEGGGAPI